MSRANFKTHRKLNVTENAKFELNFHVSLKENICLNLPMTASAVQKALCSNKLTPCALNCCKHLMCSVPTTYIMILSVITTCENTPIDYAFTKPEHKVHPYN